MDGRLLALGGVGEGGNRDFSRQAECAAKESLYQWSAAVIIVMTMPNGGVDEYGGFASLAVVAVAEGGAGVVRGYIDGVLEFTAIATAAVNHPVGVEDGSLVRVLCQVAKSHWRCSIASWKPVPSLGRAS